MAWAPPRVGQRKQDIITSIIYEGAERGWSDKYLASRLRDVLPLTDRQRTAVTVYRRSLRDQGIPPARAKMLVDRYTQRLKGQRAKTIARTERAKMETRSLHNTIGELPLEREWVSKSGCCIVCKALTGVRTSTVYGPGLPGPPAHPNCRCTEKIHKTTSRVTSTVYKATPCAVCGRPLTDPDSILRGFGPSHTKAQTTRVFNGPTVVRGINLPVTDEERRDIYKLLDPPTSKEQIGQKFTLGPVLERKLRSFEGHQGDSRFAGIGRSWTTEPRVAEMGAETGGGIPIRVKARLRVQDIEDRPEMMTDFNSLESEIRTRPDSIVLVEDIEIMQGQHWVSVWQPPTSRQQRTREVMQRIKAVTGQGFREATPEDRKRLAIPPAWTDVEVSEDPEGVNGLLARGRDAKGRRQGRYSAAHTEAQAAAKFNRVKRIAPALPRFDRQLKKDALTNDNAGALTIIRRLGMRLGGEGETGADVKAYGANTLERRHVSIEGRKVTFDFIGKKGVHITITTSDPEVLRVVKSRLAKEGGDDDQLFPSSNVDSIRAYLRKTMPEETLVKDLRTIRANELALEAISGMGRAKTMTEYKKLRLQVGEIVSGQLGNNRSEALKSYINPTVFLMLLPEGVDPQL